MASGSGSPCGACKFLRRKCATDCVFAPYFSSEHGAARFAAVHKVFGASNAAKLLLHLPPADRCDAVVTIAYEAQARIRDPVYGCVARIFALQHQVASLQLQLMQIKGQLAQKMIGLQSSCSGSQCQGIINDQYGTINPNLLLQGHSNINSHYAWESMSSSSSSSTSSQSLINGASYLPVQDVFLKEDLMSRESSSSGSSSNKRSWIMMRGAQVGELQELAFKMAGN